eukprot:scaffold24422_cov112-Isochrysis_galbana.AAC.2
MRVREKQAEASSEHASVEEKKGFARSPGSPSLWIRRMPVAVAPPGRPADRLRSLAEGVRPVIRQWRDPPEHDGAVAAAGGDGELVAREEARARHVGAVAGGGAEGRVLHHARAVEKLEGSKVVCCEQEAAVGGAVGGVDVGAVRAIGPDADCGEAEHARPRGPRCRGHVRSVRYHPLAGRHRPE